MQIDGNEYWVLTNLEPPFSQLDERGRPTGYTVELVEGILNYAGVDQMVLAAPWERILKEARVKPNVFVFALARTPERESQYHWITPITANVYGIYGRAAENKFRVLSDVSEFGSVAVLKGDFREAILRAADIDVKTYPTWLDAVDALVEKQVDGLFFSDFGLVLFCRRLQKACSDLKRLYTYELVTTYLVMSKLDSSGSEVKHFQDAAKAFKATSDYQSIVDKWLTIYQQDQVGPMHEANGVVNLWSKK
ncbi:substrate-binding periplasmic protein [Aestuariibacter salexigens]|uniref:substrate-binding periplasmic protein n=1 Tax=Aestuariibacter salexigens TaxID=226010 RepID=UPI000424F4E2|nr:transporter substrate-binding domain-containing protein [Aestuariibacter salexigens]